jgi:hypothetical protein
MDRGEEVLAGFYSAGEKLFEFSLSSRQIENSQKLMA